LVDIHCHIVPGVDDGAKNVEVALAMIEDARNMGAVAILTTPHIRGSIDDRRAHDFHVEAFQEILPYSTPELSLHLGCEVRATADIQTIVEEPSFTANEAGKWILLEMPSNEVPPYFLQSLFQFRLRGITPIVAHPERNIGVLKRPEYAIEFVKQGAHLQITTASLNGDLGEHFASCSRKLIEAGLVSFVSSDAHNTETRPFTNWTRSMEILEEIEQKSPDLSGVRQRLSHDNALAVCRNKEIKSIEISDEMESKAMALFRSSHLENQGKRKRFFFF
jgi:protein-tyrosine phosphatase